MAGHRNYNTLLDAMSPERRARIDAGVRDKIAEIVLAELRKHSDRPSSELERILGVTRREWPEGEHFDDLTVGSLARSVEDLGGNLELVVRVPGGEVRLTEFNRDQSPTADRVDEPSGGPVTPPVAAASPA